jgi:ferredoxin
MAESIPVTGCRDDLHIDQSRCLRMRFSESGCRRCIDICPHCAVMLDSGLAINAELCRGCLLCTTVCPVGALEHRIDFSDCLAKLTRVPEPVLGCIRTKECSNVAIVCLGGLSEEHFLALNHSLTGRLTLNLSMCGDCPNNPMIAELRQRLDNLAKAGLSLSGCRIFITEMAEDVHYHDESVARRSFFKSFRNSLLKSAAIIISNSNDQTERRTEYAGKRLPLRRELLNSTRSKLSLELEIKVRNHFDVCVSFENTCTRCHGCVAICPTGALKTEAIDDSPVFDQLLCTGCGLCREFCLEQAVQIFSVSSEG